MLLQTSDPRTLRDALPDFTRATHVFLPINDCRNVTEAEGGTHWSLLVVSIVDHVAFHYDSLPPGNRMEAGTITMKLGVLLNCPIRFVHLEDAPQQENSSDCGVFVCLNMRCLLLDRILRANSHQKVSMSLAGKRVDASSGRREMLKIIEGFRKEGVRRRSYVSPLLVIVIGFRSWLTCVSLGKARVHLSDIPEVLRALNSRFVRCSSWWFVLSVLYFS